MCVFLGVFAIFAFAFLFHLCPQYHTIKPCQHYFAIYFHLFYCAALRLLFRLSLSAFFSASWVAALSRFAHLPGPCTRHDQRPSAPWRGVMVWIWLGLRRENPRKRIFVEIGACLQSVFHGPPPVKLPGWNRVAGIGLDFASIPHTIICHTIPKKTHCGACEKMRFMPGSFNPVFQF